MHIINFIWKSFRCCDERQPYKSLGGPRVFRAFIVVVECGWGGGWRLSLLKQAVSTDICNPQCPAIPEHFVFYLRTEGWETQNAVPWDTGPWALSEAAGLQALALHCGCCRFCCWMSCRSWLCDCRAGFLPSSPARAPPVQGWLWVNTSVQLPKPVVSARNKACVSDEEARKAPGQGSDLAHICSKKTRF